MRPRACLNWKRGKRPTGAIWLAALLGSLVLLQFQVMAQTQNGRKGTIAIQGQTLFAPLITQNAVAVYAYPKGGKILSEFFGFGEPFATAISVLPQ